MLEISFDFTWTETSLSSRLDFFSFYYLHGSCSKNLTNPDSLFPVLICGKMISSKLLIKISTDFKY